MCSTKVKDTPRMREKWDLRNNEITMDRPKRKFQDENCAIGLESNQSKLEQEMIRPPKGRL